MKKRQWSSQQKFQIVLEGLSGQIEISQLCSKYQVSQTQYYQWRDRFLKYGHQAFETRQQGQKEQHLQEEVKRYKHLVGELTAELKKSDY